MLWVFGLPILCCSPRAASERFDVSLVSVPFNPMFACLQTHPFSLQLILQGFIEVCHTCVEKNNFNSAMAIMGGLSLISVSRLHVSQLGVPLWSSYFVCSSRTCGIRLAQTAQRNGRRCKT